MPCYTLFLLLITIFIFVEGVFLQYPEIVMTHQEINDKQSRGELYDQYL